LDVSLQLGDDLLLANHLLACVRVQVDPLQFPKSGRSTLARFPFEIK